MKTNYASFTVFFFVVSFFFIWSCKKKESSDAPAMASEPTVSCKVDTIKTSDNRIVQTIEYSGGKVSKIVYYDSQNTISSTYIYTYTNNLVRVNVFSSNNTPTEESFYYLNSNGYATKVISNYNYSNTSYYIDSTLTTYDAEGFLSDYQRYSFTSNSNQLLDYVRIGFTVKDGNYTSYKVFYGANSDFCYFTYDSTQLIKGFNQNFGETGPELDLYGKRNKNLLKSMIIDNYTIYYYYKFDANNYVTEIKEKYVQNTYSDSAIFKLSYKCQ